MQNAKSTSAECYPKLFTRMGSTRKGGKSSLYERNDNVNEFYFFSFSFFFALIFHSYIITSNYTAPSINQTCCQESKVLFPQPSIPSQAFRFQILPPKLPVPYKG